MMSKFRAWLRGDSNQEPSTTSEVERAEWKFYLSYLREGMIVFDVGAYFGEITLLFSHFVGVTGKVHSFEANPESFQRLKYVVEASGRKNIQLNHCAIADRKTELEFYQYDTAHLSWSTLAQRPLENYGVDVKPISQIKVIGETLDSYCTKNEISKIDLLKVDVEGAEYQVMIGAEKLFSEKRISCCIFEFGQTTFDMGNDPKQIEEFLKKHNYQLQNAIESDPIFPGRESAATARFAMHVAKPF
jgi:FkbM family methyltransferase